MSSTKASVLLKHGDATNMKKTSVAAGIFTFRLPKTPSKYSPARFLRCLGDRVARAVHFVAMRRRQYSSSRKVSSSASLTRSRSVAGALDSHRAEAIEDCIEFLNSSSSCSLQRSNSASSVS